MAEQSKINNIGKLFYKDYYNEVDFDNLLFGSDEEKKNLEINETIKNSLWVEIKKPIAEIIPEEAIVQYPGIVTGVGLDHDVALKDGYKLGMHFDYTHGMPVVYGSSIKGVLKTYFEDSFLENYPDRKADVKPLKELIFDGKNPKYQEGKDEPKYIPLYERDVFFDAVIAESYEGRFLEDDYITPHTDGPLKNPTPIKMLKIAPGCKMEFRFKLNTHEVNNHIYTLDMKLTIFKDILETVGVGAKTNVGYGRVTFLEGKKNANVR